MRPRPPCEILWCPNVKNADRAIAGWSFPQEVEDKIRELCDGSTILHLFGGHARFGVRLDIDPKTRPHVIGDAWMPPFAMASFETVILDPPYFTMDREMLGQLMAAASYVARSHVIWLHQLWAPSQFGLSLAKAWMVRVGDNHYVRCLQQFRRNTRVMRPPQKFTRGPAIKYNRWLAQPQGLPFGDRPSTSQPEPA